MTVSNVYNRPEKLSAELRERTLAKADDSVQALHARLNRSAARSSDLIGNATPPASQSSA
jgi:DNA-binding LacI/PurR family transcriptional regulator